MRRLFVRLIQLSFILLLAILYPLSIITSNDLTSIELNNIQDFDLSPDGKRLVVADLDHTFKVLEIETNEILFHLEDVPADTS